MQELITRVFRRIATEQEKLLQEHLVPINYIFVLESAYKNAFVHRIHPTGVRVATNLVFITTGMLRELINLDPEFLAREYPNLPPDAREARELTDGVARLGGILSHEEAHPLDTLIQYSREGANLSIEKEYGNRGAQAAELRADADGTRLNRAAHLPANSVYLAQQRTLPLDQPPSVLAGTARHPENSLRQTGARMYLTVQRLRQGHDQQLAPFKAEGLNLSAIRTDLKAFETSRGPFPWRPTETLKEPLDRLKRVSHVPIEHKPVEFNRLLLKMDQQIAQLEGSPEGLSETLAQQITETITFLLKREHYEPIWDREDRSHALNGLGDSREFLSLPSHDTYLQRLAFYQRPDYITEILGTQHHNDRQDERVARFARLSMYLPANALLKAHGKEFVRLQKEAKDRYSAKYPDLRGRALNMALPATDTADGRHMLLAFSMAMASQDIEAIYQQLGLMSRAGHAVPELTTSLRTALRTAIS